MWIWFSGGLIAFGLAYWLTHPAVLPWLLHGIHQILVTRQYYG